MIDLTIYSRALAGKILNNPKYKIDFLISIGDPDRDPPSGFHKLQPEKRLRLTFFDYTKNPNYIEPNYSGTLLYPPLIAVINQVIGFVRSKIKPVLKTNLSVLIHCEVGISRSPAIAQIVLQELGMSVETARAKVLEIRAQAVPNEFVLDLYRSLLP